MLAEALYILNKCLGDLEAGSTLAILLEMFNLKSTTWYRKELRPGNPAGLGLAAALFLGQVS